MSENLGKAVVNIVAENKTLKRDLKETEQATRSTIKNIATDLAKITGLMAQSVSSLGTISKNTANSIKEISKPIVETTTKATKSVGSLITKVTLLASSLSSLKYFFVGSIGSAVDFEYQMSQVATMLDSNTMGFIPKFKAAIMNLSETYGQSNRELADSLFTLLSARKPAQEALEYLIQSAKLAKLGFTSVDKATRLLITATEAYGGSQEDVLRISNVLFKIVEQGNFTFDDLAKSFGNVISTAKSAGISLEELGTAVGSISAILGKANTSVTSVNGILRSLIKLTGQSRAEWEAIDPAFGSAKLQLDGIAGVLEKLKNAKPEQLAKLFGSIQGFRGFTSLDTKGLEDFTKRLRAISSSINTVDEKISIVTETAKTFEDITKQAMTNLKIALGDTVLKEYKSILDIITNVIKETRSWVDDSKELVKYLFKASGLLTIIASLTTTIMLISTYIGVAVLAKWLIPMTLISLVLADWKKSLEFVGISFKLLGETAKYVLFIIGIYVEAFLEFAGKLKDMFLHSIDIVFYGAKLAILNVISMLTNLYDNIKSNGLVYFNNLIASMINSVGKFGRIVFNAFISSVEELINYVITKVNFLIGKIRPLILLGGGYIEKYLGIPAKKLLDYFTDINKVNFGAMKFTAMEMDRPLIDFKKTKDTKDILTASGDDALNKKINDTKSKIEDTTKFIYDTAASIKDVFTNWYDNQLMNSKENTRAQASLFEKIFNLFSTETVKTAERKKKEVAPLPYQAPKETSKTRANPFFKELFMYKFKEKMSGEVFPNNNLSLKGTSDREVLNGIRRRSAELLEQNRLEKEAYDKKKVMILGFYQDTTVAAAEYYDNLRSELTSGFTKSFDEFLKFKDGFLGSLKSLAKSMGDTILGAFRQIIAEMIAKKVVNAGLDFFPSIKSFFGLDATKTATGGIISAAYASGGMVNKPSYIMAGEAGKERVLSNRQTKAFENMVKNNFQMGSQKQPNVNVNIQNNTGTAIQANQALLTNDGKNFVLNVIMEEKLNNPNFFRG